MVVPSAEQPVNTWASMHEWFLTGKPQDENSRRLRLPEVWECLKQTKCGGSVRLLVEKERLRRPPDTKTELGDDKQSAVLREMLAEPVEVGEGKPADAVAVRFARRDGRWVISGIAAGSFRVPVTSVQLTTDDVPGEFPDVVRLLALAPTGTPFQFQGLAVAQGLDDATTSPANQLSVPSCFRWFWQSPWAGRRSRSPSSRLPPGPRGLMT